MFLPPSTGLLLGFSAGKGVNKCTQLVRLGCLMATWRPVSPLEGPQHKGHLVDVSLVGACGGGQERPRDLAKEEKSGKGQSHGLDRGSVGDRRGTKAVSLKLSLSPKALTTPLPAPRSSGKLPCRKREAGPSPAASWPPAGAPDPFQSPGQLWRSPSESRDLLPRPLGPHVQAAGG